VAFSPFDEAWESGFSMLEQFRAEFGHVAVTQTQDFRGFRLGSWVANQRTKRRDGRLEESRAQRLERLGVDFEPMLSNWAMYCSALKSFVCIFGHGQVPQTYEADGLKLGRWVNKQRQRLRRGVMEPDRKQELDRLGLVWNPLEESQGASNEAHRR